MSGQNVGILKYNYEKKSDLGVVATLPQFNRGGKSTSTLKDI